MFAFLTIATFIIGLTIAVIAPTVAHAIKLAEFRQQWINDQRNDVAEYLSLARRWFELYNKYNDIEINNHKGREALFEKQFRLANKAFVVLWRIEMRMNPLENNPDKAKDDAFLKALKTLIDPGQVAPHPINPPETRWHKYVEPAVSESKFLFKREWEKAKAIPSKWFWAIPSFGRDVWRERPWRPTNQPSRLP